jgi:serine/threonine protein kinase
VAVVELNALHIYNNRTTTSSHHLHRHVIMTTFINISRISIPTTIAKRITSSLQIYLVMDYVEGGSVTQSMTDDNGVLHPLNEEITRTYVIRRQLQLAFSSSCK